MDALSTLETTRVVIVDDNVEEGTALLRALSRHGVGAAFFQGETDEPANPLTGIRLLALDMKLHSNETDPKNIVSTLISVTGKIISEDNGPFILLLWTNQDVELVADYRKALRKEHPNLMPVVVAMLPKSSVIPQQDAVVPQAIETKVKILMDKLQSAELEPGVWEDIERTIDDLRRETANLAAAEKREVNLEALVRELTFCVQRSVPFTMLVNWERKVNGAASRTTLELSRLIRPYVKKPDDPVARAKEQVASTVLAPISQESVGPAQPVEEPDPQPALKPVDSADDWHVEMLRFLATLAQATGGKELTHSDPVSPLNKPEQVDAAFAYESLLNSLNPLHYDQLEYHALYEGAGVDGEYGELGLKHQALQNDAAGKPKRHRLNHMLLMTRPPQNGRRPSTGNVYLQEQMSLESMNISQADIAEPAMKSLAKNETALKSTLPVFVDITPSCDYAQRKVGLARLAAGLLIPDGKRTAKSEMQMSVGLVSLSMEDGDPADGSYWLVLDSRYIVGMSTEELAKRTASYRLRSQATVAVQAWAAQQVARPGYTFIE